MRYNLFEVPYWYDNLCEVSYWYDNLCEVSYWSDIRCGFIDICCEVSLRNIILKSIKGHISVEKFRKIMCISHNMDHIYQCIKKILSKSIPYF